MFKSYAKGQDVFFSIVANSVVHFLTAIHRLFQENGTEFRCHSCPPPLSKIKREVYIPLVVINKICRMLYTQFYLVSAFVCRQQLRYFPAKMCFQVDSTTIKLKYFFRVAGKKYFHSSQYVLDRLSAKYVGIQFPPPAPWPPLLSYHSS